MIFTKQFFKLTGFLLIILFFSYIAFLFPVINKLLFLVILIITAGISFKNLTYGVYIALIELFNGSQGYLFYWELSSFKISLRLGIFMVLFLAFFYHTFKAKRIYFLSYKNQKFYWAFALMLIFGVITALLYGYPIKDIFLDVNGYIYFAYIIIFTQIIGEYKESKNIKTLEDSTKYILQKLGELICASITTITIHSLFLLYIFSHSLESWMRPLYKWTRDHRIGEIARPFITSDFHRIFFQHQIFTVLLFIIFITLLFFYRKNLSKNIKRDLLIITVLSFSVVLLSFSRSFWAGLVVTACFMFIYLIILYKKDWKSYIKSIVMLLSVIIASILLMISVMNFPLPGQRYISSTDLFKNRLNFTTEAAVASRWNLLPIIVKANKKHPLIGYGFGKQLRYQADDPRIRNENNPNGWFTTYAFEWGYLDIILKIGILGLLIYGILLVNILKQGIQAYKNLPNSLIKYTTVGILFSLTCLMLIHIFTPYLNHPLGIGYIVLVQMYVDIVSE